MKLTSAAMGSLQAASATRGLAGSANQQLLAARAGVAGNQTASPSKNAAISRKRALELGARVFTTSMVSSEPALADLERDDIQIPCR